ncbi:MAG TPA: CoA-binding protein, partial [Smithellaceae bacterium]|nr:CoA-binding protein [Smithellaceae bacterium]HOR62916.1 CoA-binding protein [Smithellaceae bacterium]HPL32418.1 CoA-binding protein [Smithellaceae bacterium]
MNQSASLDFLFHPRSIAIAGVSENANKFNFGKRYLQGLIEFGFPGKIYPLNPAGGEAEGIPLYKSLREIPGDVDYIISAIPAP